MGIYDQEGIAQELRDVTISVLEGEGLPAALRDTKSDAPLNPDLWHALTRVGLPTVLLSETHGGIGGGPKELAAVCDALGQRLVRAPITEALIAYNVLAASGHFGRVKEMLHDGDVATIAGEAHSTDWDLPWAGAEWKGGRLTGLRTPVNFGADADVILVTCEANGGPALVEATLNDKRSVLIEVLETTDKSYRPTRLEFSDHPAQLVAEGQEAVAHWAKAENLARLGVVSEVTGLTTALVAMAVEHAQGRAQFGRPIGSFQAVKHLVADMHVSAENLASIRNALAKDLAETPSGGASRMAASAKAQATRLAMEVCEKALQIFGGIGFTSEHDLSLYYQRVMTLSDTWGTEGDIELSMGRSILGADE